MTSVPSATAQAAPERAAEPLDEFRTRAHAWLEEVRPPRPQATTRWGEGDFDVTIFHDLSPDAERAHLAELVRWHHERLDAGFGGITWPVEDGGLGLPDSYERAWAELEAQFDVLGGHELFNVTVKLVAPSIRVHGTPEQRERFLQRFLRAEELCCQLFSEPGSGSDLASVGTRATRTEGGDWILDGQKVWTSGGHLSSWGLAVCRTDSSVPKHRGMTAFLVPMDAPGVEVRLIRQMSGGSSFSEVFFSDTPIPDDLRIGEVGDGWRVALTVLGFERSTAGSSSDKGGSFEQLLGVARAMGKDQEAVTRQHLAEAYTLGNVRRWTRERAMAALRAGQQPGPEGSLGKLLWTEGLKQTSEAVSHILGPALTADTGTWGTYAWTDHVLGAPGYRIAGGSDEIQRNIIGERVLGLPPEPRVDRDVPFSEVPRS